MEDLVRFGCANQVDFIYFIEYKTRVAYAIQYMCKSHALKLPHASFKVLNSLANIF